MPKTIAIFITLLMLVLPSVSALAKPEVAIETISEKELIELVDGRETRRTVPAREIEPGQTIIFTLHYSNHGDEAATNVVISNPIPNGTHYVVGSATGESPLFSIDGGIVYKKPSLLTYEAVTRDGGKVSKVASPEQYTDIRWVVPNVAPGTEGSVSFRVKVD